MSKIVFNQDQQLDLMQRLQLLLLDAVMSSGNWKHDEIRFQGGTSLSLVHGSPRFSEDLDFIIVTDKGLSRMIAAAQTRMTNTLRALLPGAEVKFGGRDEDPESRDAKNPRTFNMNVSHPNWYRTVKIKLEFWLADPEAVAQYESGIKTARILSSVVQGNPLRATIAPVFVNTATLDEIVVDKLHALVSRNRMKHRDVFDLWWLKEQGNANWSECLTARYEHHQKMYSDAPLLQELPARLLAKSDEIKAMVGRKEFSGDLAKWLGNGAGLSTQQSADTIATSVSEHLKHCVACLENNLQSPAGTPKKGLRP